jgi:putative ABC transport system substrate-binding protein
MRRREFIAGLGGAAVWPRVARAQQPVMPVVGFLAVGANGANRWGEAFKQSLKDAGYIEGQNVAIEYSGGPPRMDRLRELAADFVRRQVAVILTSNDGSALAAKRATSTIPIIFFNVFSDPEKLGLVNSISRPGGNVTGVGFDNAKLAAKRLDLLCQLVPTVAVAYLTTGFGLSFEEEKDALVAAAAMLGRQLIIVKSRTDDELGQAFETIVERGAGAAIVGTFTVRLNPSKIVSLAAQYKIPTVYPSRAFVLRGGLMSYSTDLTEHIRIAATMVGQVLNGAKPADLPVRRSSNFDFVINLGAAKELGVQVPPSFLVLANHVID